MNRFAPLLKSINTKLDLPQPTKSRIILEIAADLEDLYRFYQNQGMREEEAFEKAKEKFEVNDEALLDLVQIHESPFRRWMDRISEQTQNRWEHRVMVLILIFISLLSAKAILSTRFFINTSLFVLPMVGMAFFILAKSLEKGYYLFIKKNHDIRTLRKGLTTFLILGGCNLFTGICGYFVELYVAGNKTIFVGLLGVLCITPRSTEYRTLVLTEWLSKSASMIMVCMFVTILIAMLWFLLWNKVKKIEAAEAECLLLE